MNSHLKTTLFLCVELCSLVIFTDFSKCLPDNISHPRRYLYSPQCTLGTFTPRKHLWGSRDTAIFLQVPELIFCVDIAKIDFSTWWNVFVSCLLHGLAKGKKFEIFSFQIVEPDYN